MPKITSVQAVRGMPDILPAQVKLWHFFEKTARQLMDGYGYQEIRTPILESTALFKRSIGEVTDIVEKEMYTFEDRNGDSLSLRPEGTAGCVRACIEHGLLYHQTQRLWYYGSMYRHERPQKGRYRQFYQLGVESLGFSSPQADAELILMTARLWRELGVSQAVTLQLNSLGVLSERERYKKALVDYLMTHQSQLDEDSLRRLKLNPLRILDSKNPAMQDLIQQAPQFEAYLGEASLKHIETVKTLLTEAGVPFVMNPRLVRGLDYYNHTVFEWVTTQLGAQGTVCAGGRYDGLVEELGGAATPGVGFGVGVERVLILLEIVAEAVSAYAPDVYLVYQTEALASEAILLAERLRDVIPGLCLLSDGSGGKLANQFKRADKSQAQLALVLGEKEQQEGAVTIKYLRENRPQVTILQSSLPDFLANELRAKNG